MTKTDDIINKVYSDFDENSELAIKILDDALTNFDYLNNDRIIRCIIYLAEKQLDKLKQSIEHARQDPRDIMLWAEYINLGPNQTPKRVRDFNKSFGNCEITNL